MLKFIYGPMGSGKTYLTDTLILKALGEGKKVTLLVPEQEAIDAENRIYDRALLSDTKIEKLTVVSFRRLANLAFRKHGGIEYNNIGEGGRLIVLYRIIEELTDALKVYKSSKDRSFIELMLSVCSELKRYSVTPSMLSLASDGAENQHLKDKLSDIALIYAAYGSQMSGIYTDSTDDINRLAQIYRNEKPDKNEMFFVDSFNGFTAPELDVLAQLIKHCKVTVSLTVPHAKGQTGFLTLENTEKALRDIAKNAKADVAVIADLSSENGYSKKEFELIKRHLFDRSYVATEGKSTDRVVLACCSDAFSQAEFIARRICEAVRGGARYKDIAVITRNADRFDGVLDVVFEKYGIPVFLSKRNKLTSSAIYKAVNAVLNIISNNFDTEDVISYIKSGVCGFSLAEIDLIESYVMLWQINGRRWTDENDWLMNPLGFTDDLTNGSAELLEQINALRRKIIMPIKALAEDIRSVSVSDACKAVYSFILNGEIGNFYKQTTDKADVTAYNTFISILDTLNTVGSDIPVNASVFSSLLYLVAKNTDYGAIPSNLDRVTAGDASIIRCNGIKHVFLTDCQNGIFPASVSDDSFFTDREKRFLITKGISLSPDISEKNDLEAFYFLRAASGATETLTATYCLSDGAKHPSMGFDRLCALFPSNTVLYIPDMCSPTEKIQSLQTFRDEIRVYKNTKYYPLIKELAAELGIEKHLLENTKLNTASERISRENIELLFGTDIGMSYTRFETYVKCPFSYFCKYVLGLKEKKYGYFAQSDMGSYIHRILEKSINNLFSSGNITEKTDTDIEKALDTSFTEVVSAIVGNDFSREGKRFEALLTRLKRTVKMISENIVSEFKNSDFRPRFFELAIGKRDGAISPLKIRIDEESTMSVYGSIDRVDVYEKDGNAYVRVLDYKSGSTEHALDNIEYGLDTQMLLYLFAIWKDGNKDFKKLLENRVENIIPAGVLYQKASISVVDTKTPLPTELARQKANETLVRSGMLLDDINILNAMEHGIKGNYLPVKADGDKLKSKGKVLASADEFEALYQQISDTLSEYGKMMKSGEASPKPISVPKQNPCKYCKLYPICRNKRNGGEADADTEN